MDGEVGPTMNEFKTFYETYCSACRNRDRAFLKAMLPADIPDDELTFVVESSQAMIQGLDASGVKPDYVRSNNRFDVIYQGNLGDGMTRWEMDFYYAGGAWLKYDPDAPPEQQGFSNAVKEGAAAATPKPPSTEDFEPQEDHLVKPPASSDRAKITPLGYIEARDEPTNKAYAWAVWREEQAGGTWRFVTKGNSTGGTRLDPAHPSFRSNMAKAAVKGLNHILVGFSMTPKGGDARKAETRIDFDDDLNPLRVELRVAMRNADGSPKEEKVLALPWPAPEGAGEPPAPVVGAPKSTDARPVEELAYLNAYDVIADKDYGYVAYKETQASTGKWTLKIKAKSTAGASLDPNHPSFKKNIEAASGKGEDHVVFGFRLEPKEEDPRLVENRLYFDASRKPERVEIHLVTRNADGSAKDRQTASFPWPE
ncbi:MAG: hypothetical protein ACYTHM_12290 [Planctomycetota bacterium]|jgi:hypothetical protein